MFVYSVRASTIRFFLAVFLCLSVLLGVIVFGGRGNVYTPVSAANDIRFTGMKNTGARTDYFRQFGIEVDPESEEEKTFALPENFDRVLVGYGELQKKLGLDLSKYKNKRVTRYSYRVKTEGGEQVYANMLTFRDRVIACDISSADPTGFVLCPLDYPEALAGD